MDWFPVFHRFSDQKILIIGGGDIAERKADLLLRSGAQIDVVARDVCESLAIRAVNVIAQEFSAEQVDGYALVIAATDDKSLNAAVAAAANAARIPVNVVDQPELCSCIMPSVLDRSPVIIAVSSGGSAPVLARMVRARLETLFPAGYGRLGGLVGDYREAVKASMPMKLRRRFWEDALEGPIGEQVLAGRDEEAEVALKEMLERYQQDADNAVQGEVYLVGGGPGDPDLLTFRALRLMQKADVVLYDRLVSKAVLDLVRRDAERIDVGKKRDQHPVPQDQINQRLVDLAKQGKRVLRLKGGDPFIFGRGGEEIDLLAENNIPFQVVPGITAASGCSSYAGIPLTHRDHAQSCQFVTGHLKQGEIELNWESLVQAGQTVVFYMSLHTLEQVSSKLIAHGAPASRPVALVERGTTADQRVVVTTLENAAADAKAADVKPPALVIVGDVVTLREKLQWFGG